jgi:hypothetical protein
MSRTALSMALGMVAGLTVGLGPDARADEPSAGDVTEETGSVEAMPSDYAPPVAPGQDDGPAPPIPPYVDEPPVAAQAGGYCFDGPHPVDSRVEPGVTWDNTSGRHIHPYPPFDLRLFSFQNGCYYFIGDPTDFGYAGDTYSYYGAHPILGIYGGGWCFMIGPHRHFWRPWSPLFATVGPWYYWEGPYDPFFWTYWPFYHYYYRHHYPTYYARGAFFRSHAVAPRITSVPRPMGRAGAGWRGGGPGLRAAPGPAGRGARGAPGGLRGGPTAPRGAGPGMNRGAPMQRGGVRPAPGGGGFAPRNFSPPARTGGGPRSFSPPGRSSGGFAPRSFSPPARGGGGFSPRGFSSPAPRSGGSFGGGRFGGGHFGGGGRGRR